MKNITLFAMFILFSIFGIVFLVSAVSGLATLTGIYPNPVIVNPVQTIMIGGYASVVSFAIAFVSFIMLEKIP